MNVLQQSTVSQERPTRPRPSTRKSRKVAISLLAMLIAVALVAWFGFLGWGAVAMLRWLF